jgi:excisionase family DNA binding protein
MRRMELPASASAPDTRVDELLTVRELGAMLKISPASVYRLVERRHLPFYRLPHKLRFRKHDVEEYLATRRVDVLRT